MYKLLTTAAVILTVATPSIADQWTGHKDLVNKLEQTYGYLDGESQFGDLQGAYDPDAVIGSQTGQLSNFFGTVDKGVTYITLTVDSDTNAITPGINKGVAFSEIVDAKDELVQRVNYDLFVSTDDEAVTGFDRTNGTYDSVKTQKLTITGTPENSSDNDYTQNLGNGGLAGVKIDNLVKDVNTINEFLIAGTTSASQSKTFIEEFDAGTGSTAGVEIANVFSSIDDLNNAIALGQDGSGNLFGNIDLGAVSETNINDFAIPAYNAYNDIGLSATAPGGYVTISDWANEKQTVVTTAGTGTVKGTGTVEIVDSAAGTITVGGVPYTLAGGEFVAD